MNELKDLQIYMPKPDGSFDKQTYSVGFYDSKTAQYVEDIVQLDSSSFQITLNDDSRYIVSSPYYVYLETPNQDGYYHHNNR